MYQTGPISCVLLEIWNYQTQYCNSVCGTSNTKELSDTIK